MERVIIRTNRDGYSTSQVKRTMTVEELISQLEQFDSKSPVYLSFDDGYTFGGLNTRDIDSEEVTDEK